MADRFARVMFSRRRALCGCVATLGAFVVGGMTASASDQRMTPIVKAFQNCRGAVVSIRGEKTLVTGATQVGHTDSGRRVNGMGTGVVIDPRGYVLTNHHVVDGVREIQVTLDDGRKLPANMLARHPETDLAIIKLELSEGVKMPVVSIGTSSDLMPGEWVIAVGNAFGYEQTVTRGIISALHRAVQVSDAQYYDDLIQTDASINPGNSGGPLLNIDGDMVGVNVAVRAGAQGIGFAIPVDKAMAVATALLAEAGVKNHWHGVVASKESPASGQGMAVASVEEKSPAEKAGMKPGDVVTNVKSAAGGSTPEVKVQSALDFHRALVETKAGEEIELTVRRGDEELHVQFALDQPQQNLRPINSPIWDLLGLDLKSIPQEEFRQQYAKFLKNYQGGLLIAAVRPQSPAAEQGLHRGDVLVGLHDRAMVTTGNVVWILSNPEFASYNPVKFYILRGQDAFFGHMPINVAQTPTVRK